MKKGFFISSWKEYWEHKEEWCSKSRKLLFLSAWFSLQKWRGHKIHESIACFRSSLFHLHHHLWYNQWDESNCIYNLKQLYPKKTRKLKYIRPGTDSSPAVGNSISCLRLLFIIGSITDFLLSLECVTSSLNS